jgi:hypothetical protein
VLNAIEQYDWLYELRNKRAYRKFWDTSGYVGGVYASIYDIQRMWHLASSTGAAAACRRSSSVSIRSRTRRTC